MTEAEWLMSGDRAAAVAFLRDRVSDRKLRLYLCAGCRAIWQSLPCKESREAVEVAERFADVEDTADELGRVAYHSEADCLHELLPDHSSFAAAWLANYAASEGRFRRDPESWKP